MSLFTPHGRPRRPTRLRGGVRGGAGPSDALRTYIADLNPAFYWHMDEAAAPIVNHGSMGAGVGNGLYMSTEPNPPGADGPLYDADPIAPGYTGRSIEMIPRATTTGYVRSNGGDALVNSGHGQGAFSIGFLMKSSFQGSQVIFSTRTTNAFEGSVQCFTNFEGTLSFWAYRFSLQWFITTSGVNVLDGEPHSIGLTRAANAGGAVKVFVDGVERASGTCAGTWIPNGNLVIVGHNQRDGGQAFIGHVSDLFSCLGTVLDASVWGDIDTLAMVGG